MASGLHRLMLQPRVKISEEDWRDMTCHVASPGLFCLLQWVSFAVILSLFCLYRSLLHLLTGMAAADDTLTATQFFEVVRNQVRLV